MRRCSICGMPSDLVKIDDGDELAHDLCLQRTVIAMVVSGLSVEQVRQAFGLAP